MQTPANTTQTDPRFTPTSRTTWRFTGQTITGRIELRKMGLLPKRWNAIINKDPRITYMQKDQGLSFAEHELNEAKQWLANQDKIRGELQCNT